MSNTFVSIFSFAQFSNPLAFKHLNTEDIANIEKSVQSKMLVMLERNLRDESGADEGSDVVVDDETLKEYFGDVYFADTNNFQFMPGDLKLIELMVEHVKTTATAKGENKGLSRYKPHQNQLKSGPLRQCTKMNQLRTEHNEKSNDDPSSELLRQLHLSLYKKIMKCMQLYGVNDIVNLENVSSEDIVAVSWHKSQILGHVYCIICRSDSNEKNSAEKSFIQFKWLLDSIKLYNSFESRT